MHAAKNKDPSKSSGILLGILGPNEIKTQASSVFAL